MRFYWRRSTETNLILRRSASSVAEQYSIHWTHRVKLLSVRPSQGRLLLELDAPTLPKLAPAHLTTGTRFAGETVHCTMEVSSWTIIVSCARDTQTATHKQLLLAASSYVAVVKRRCRIRSRIPCLERSGSLPGRECRVCAWTDAVAADDEVVKARRSHRV